MKKQLVLLRSKFVASTEDIFIVNDECLNKARNAFYTSTLIDKNSSEHVEFCATEMQERLVNRYRYIITVKRSARVFEIESIKDLSYIHKHYNAFERYFHHNFIDFEKMRFDYDAVHLANIELIYEKNKYYRLSAYDYEQTMFFRQVFSKVEEIK